MKGSIEMNVLEGKLVAEGMKIGIVCARFNEFITSKLLGGAMDALVRHGYRAHLKFLWLLRKWLQQASTMQSSAWVLSSKVLHLIMIMFVQKYLKVLQLFHYHPVCRFSSVF